MKRYNYPTTIYFGDEALKTAATTMVKKGLKHPLLVADKTLTKIGLVEQVAKTLKDSGLKVSIFDETHPNPIEDDVDKGAEAYLQNSCDSIVALGGGSPMDAAKVIAIKATQSGPLAQFDDAKGGDALIDEKKLPPIYAIPTTAGTGSEVGRCGVIIMKATNDKTIFFHPKLLPEIAILEPKFLAGLPPMITAATGIDALTHSLEAYFAPDFHPLADGIALESIRLILQNLKTSVDNGKDLEARGKMMMAATMGATAFQKGLGMIHSLAHPLSSECGLHHGLANALLLPYAVEFLEQSSLNSEQKSRIQKMLQLFREEGWGEESLSRASKKFIEAVGIKFGLRHHNVKESDIPKLTKKAFQDGCHKTNMIPVNEANLQAVYQKAF